MGVEKVGAHINWSMVLPSEPVKLPYEGFWPCAGGLPVANAVGTQLRDLIKSGLNRRRNTVMMETEAEIGREEWSPVSKHQIQPGCGE